MTSHLNNLLSNWITKEANWTWADVIKPFLKGVATNSKRIGKGALGVGLGSAGIEMAGRTIGNIAGGDPSIGQPTWTEHQMKSLVHGIGVGTGANAVMSNATRAGIEGLDTSPYFQKILDSTSNLTDPTVRQKMMEQLANTMQQRGGQIGQTVGKGIGKGFFTGAYDDLHDHPIKSLGGLALLGAGPAVGYDLLTRKRREEDQERNNAILQHLQNNQKTASYIPTLGPAFKWMAKNPIKSFLIPSTTAGLGTSVLGKHTHPEQYAGTVNAANQLGNNLTAAPTGLFEAAETGLVGNPLEGVTKSPTLDKLHGIKSNLNNMLQQLSEKMKPQPANTTPSSSFEKYKPWIGGAAAIGVPASTYVAYRHFGEHDLNQAKKENKKGFKELSAK